MRIDIERARFIATTEIQDSNLYLVDCPKGHKAYVILQEQKFELLFDIGACAILDGYHREAVTSFTSSLERFYEYFVRAALLQNGSSNDDVESIWKRMSRQSERQLGAFIVTYLREVGGSLPILSEKDSNFRNEIIHQGRIPTRNEAIEYGQKILDLIRPTLKIAKEEFSKGTDAILHMHMLGAHNRANQGRPIATSSMPSILGLSIADENHHTRNLEKALEGLKMWNWKI
jgi:hypothetical protein